MSSDLDLATDVAAIVEHPRVEPPDSFVLHAPLELLARHVLLPRVSASHREIARQRFAELADHYEAFGPAIPPPGDRSFPTTQGAAAHLVAMINARELDEVDATATWLGSNASHRELATYLGDAIAPMLGAAGHAPIFLAHLPLAAPNGEVTARLLRPLARSLAQWPEPAVRWIDELTATSPGSAESLFDALAEVHQSTRPESDFIEPTMRLVDTPDTAARLGPAIASPANSPTPLAQAIMRAAAWSMVDEPGPSSPYGWSHCLTMPQAVLALLPTSHDPRRLIALAATHVTGFRSAQATAPLHTALDEPELRGDPLDPVEARHAGPSAAAAAAFVTPPDERPVLIGHLIDFAATHHDAHLVKYTLSCLRAAAFDPSEERLYLAAAASLGAWWATADQPVQG